jgi:hypothetical protein
MAQTSVTQLQCLACGDDVVLEDRVVHCFCGRSTARPDHDGHTYQGPACPVVNTLAYDPEHQRMAPRTIRVVDGVQLHRARTHPLQ